jgi:hypothetical protein
LRRSFTDDVGPDAVIGVLLRSTIIDLPAKEDLMTPNIETIIKDHVTLTVRCLDRIYLQGYMPKLQTSGGLCYFLRDHLGHPMPSPALFRPMHDRFVAAIKTCAADHAVPLIEFEAGQDKDAIVATHRARFRGEDGVVVIGVAQEKARAFKAHKRTGPQGGVTFDFTRQSVAVNHYYFYVQDREWGPAFVKIGTYLPYPIKLCLNGHEWVKQQLRRAGIPFTSLDNGFLSCADPARLQTICGQLGPRDLQQFFDRWSHRLPWPLRAEDRAAGFDHRVTICQLEISLTQIFDRPVQGRHFLKASFGRIWIWAARIGSACSFPVGSRAGLLLPPTDTARESLPTALSRVCTSTTSTPISSSTSKKAGASAPNSRSTTPTTSISAKPSTNSQGYARSVIRSIAPCSRSNA